MLSLLGCAIFRGMTSAISLINEPAALVLLSEAARILLQPL
jgi:hypothetical protein